MNGSVLNDGRGRSAAGLVLVAFLFGASLLGQETPVSLPTPARSQTVLLEYREVPFSFFQANPRLTSENKPFVKEPGALGKNAIRGRLVFDKNNHSVPYLWDYKKRRLYLDLNGNQDLTDDVQGGYAPVSLRVSDHHQCFTNLHLVFPSPSGNHRALVDLTLYQGSPQPFAFMECHSFWEGRIMLQGKEWQLGFIESDLSGSTASEGFVLLRAWAGRDKSFSLNRSSATLDAFAFSRNIFFDTQAYRVEGQFVHQENVPKYQMTWREQTMPLGSLQLTGQFIDRLVLTRQAEKPGLESMQVVLLQPRPIVQIPTGTYQGWQVHLKTAQAGANPLKQERASQLAAPLVVSSLTNPSTLAIGGPLTNSVQIRSEGRVVRFTYQLVGAGGTTYQLLTQDRGKPPTFTISKSGKAIHSGRFEFG